MAFLNVAKELLTLVTCRNLLADNDRGGDKKEPKTNNIPQDPIFRYNATADYLPVLRSSFSTFRTTVLLVPPTAQRDSSSLQDYPFDQYVDGGIRPVLHTDFIISYIVQIFLFATDSRTGQDVILVPKYSGGVAV